MLYSTAYKYLKIEPCGTFEDTRLEQRFEVMNEELSSVCAKFAHGIPFMSVFIQNCNYQSSFITMLSVGVICLTLESFR